MREQRLAWSGKLATISFVFALVVFSVLRPEYSNLTNAVSELGFAGAPYSIIWNVVAFIFVGILVVVFAQALRTNLRSEPGAVVVPILVGISGIGFAGLGVFPADPGFNPSLATSLHFAMVSVNYLPFVIVAFVFAAKLKAHLYWKRWAIFSGSIGVVAIASFFIPSTIPAGISQRVGIGAYFVWLFIMGVALLRKPVRA